MIKKIKSFLLLNFLLISFFSCNSLTKNEINNNVIITGHIDHFNEYSNKFVSVKAFVNEFASGDQKDFTSLINADGDFELQIKKDYPQDIYLLYAERLFTIFVVPGEKINTNFNARLLAKGDDINKAITFSGNSAMLNTNIVNYQTQYYQYVPEKFRGDPDRMAQKLTPDEYSKYIYNRREKHREFLNNFISRNKVSETFINWATFEIDYDCAEALLDYSSQQKKRRRKEGKSDNYDAPESYYKFVEEFKLDNKKAVISSAYKSYISGYKHYLKRKYLKEEDWKNRNTLYKKYYDMLSKNVQGFCREVLLTQLFSEVLESSYSNSLDDYYQSYLKTVETEYLKNYIVTKYNFVNSDTLIESPENASLNELTEQVNKDSFLLSIINEHKGNVIYIDFWATWCGPCLAEMQIFNKLHEKYKGKNISFVYLCSRSSRKMWESTIAEKKLSGHHYFLNNKQFELISPSFGIVSFPHHAIIDNKGKIVKKKAESPSIGYGKEINQKLINDLNNLL